MKISFDGDSISVQASYGFVAHWILDTPGVTTTNLSVAGACIAATENATNNLDGRVSNVASFAPDLHVICIGTNDMAAIDANTTISRLTTHIGNLRAAGVTAKIAVCGVGPCSPTSTGGHANVNGRRGSYNAQLRAAVGGLIDAYIPRGEHPVFDTDAAASNTTWWNADGIHPLQLPHRAYWQMLHDVLDPFVAGSVATDPTSVPLPNIDNAAIGTAATMRGRVTGMALGHSATMSVSGGAQIARGLGAFGTSDLSVMNGDVVLAQRAASGSYATTLNSTVSIGTLAITWAVKTRPQAWPVTGMTLDPAHKASTVTLSADLLTATAGSGNANQLAMATAPAANDWTYFEVTLGVAGDTASAKKIAIHDASLIANYNKIPGLNAGFTTAGLTIVAGGTVVVDVNGVAVASGNVAADYLTVSTLASGAVVGVLLHRPTGKVWLQTAAGTYWPGDPTVLDGGFQPPAPLAQYYCSLIVQTNAQGETVNYGAKPFAYPLPTNFAPMDAPAVSIGTGSGSLPLTGAASVAALVRGGAAGAVALTGSSGGAVRVKASASGTLPLVGTGAIGGPLTVHGVAISTLSLTGGATGKIIAKAAAGGALALTGASAARALVKGAANDNFALTGSATAAIDNVVVTPSGRTIVGELSSRLAVGQRLG